MSDFQIVQTVESLRRRHLFQSRRFFYGFGAGDGAGPMLEWHARVAQIRILKGDDFVAQGWHDARGGAVLADFQVESLVDVDDEILQGRGQVFR